NVLQHHSYSVETEEPFAPTFLRVPGYPLFLAGVYKIFGIDNNTAARIIQAVVSTVTCWLVALLALAWSPPHWDTRERRRVFLLALGASALCPFTAIYVSTILTETWATFFATASVLAASVALRAENRSKRISWWTAAGLLGGAVTMFRPDGALFVAPAGIVLV